METVEIIVFFAVAVIAGGLVVGFISDWNYWDVFDFMKQDTVNLEFEELTKEEFVGKLPVILKQCEAPVQVDYYVKGSGEFTKADLFSLVKALNWCKTIQSNEQSCGVRENVVFNRKIILPEVVTVRCEDSILYLG